MELQTTVFEKEEIIKELNKAKEEIIELCSSIEEKPFFENYIEGKWSMAENLEHLNISAKGAIKALGTNKILLRAFGTSNGTSRSSNDLLAEYKAVLSKGLIGPARFDPKVEKYNNQNEIIAVWKSVMERVAERMDKWSVKDLDKYCVKHPALGKITIRELLLFTIFHTRHHYLTIQGLFDLSLAKK